MIAVKDGCCFSSDEDCKSDKILGRLLSVQAVYQVDFYGSNKSFLVSVISTLSKYDVSDICDVDKETLHDLPFCKCDKLLLEHIAFGVLERKSQIDDYIVKFLIDGWVLERIDSVLKAILRCAIFEIIECKEKNEETGHIVDTYSKITASFSPDQKQVDFVKAVIHKVHSFLDKDDTAVPNTKIEIV